MSVVEVHFVISWSSLMNNFVCVAKWDLCREGQNHGDEPLELRHHCSAAIKWSAIIITSISSSHVFMVSVIIIVILIVSINSNATITNSQKQLSNN